MHPHHPTRQGGLVLGERTRKSNNKIFELLTEHQPSRGDVDESGLEIAYCVIVSRFFGMIFLGQETHAEGKKTVQLGNENALNN